MKYVLLHKVKASLDKGIWFSLKLTDWKAVISSLKLYYNFQPKKYTSCFYIFKKTIKYIFNKYFQIEK